MIRKFAYFVRGFAWTLYLRACGAKIGKRLRVERGLQFRQFGHLAVGDDVFIGPGCIVDAPGMLTIGSRVTLTAWNYISAVESVSIGDEALIGERVSIRDADHGMEPGEPMNRQPMTPAAVQIGADTWLGAGVVVLRGTTIGDGAVAGSNAVVKGMVEPLAIVAGVPAKKIGSRHATPTEVM